MRFPIAFEGFPPRVYVRWHGWRYRIHHVWLALLWALTDIRDWRVWVSDLRRRPE